MNKVTKRYLKECKHTFPFVGEKEKLFLKRLEENLNDTDDDVTYEEICLKFGLPKNVMISYIENCDNQYILKSSSIKSTIKKAFITLFCLVMLTCLILIYYNIAMYSEYKESNIINHETIIEGD